MINLIKNELYKVFHKKSTLIVILVMVAFALLNNIIYKNMHVNRGYGYVYESDYNDAKEYLTNNELNSDNYEDYVFYQTVLAVGDLNKKYDEEWQKDVIGSDLYSIYYDYYMNSYYGNTEVVEENQNRINNIIKALDSNDWQSIVNERIDNLKNELLGYKEELKNNTSKRNEVEINKRIEVVEKEIELYEYRIKENLIIGGNTYLDDAINVVNGTIYDVVNNKYSSDNRYAIKNTLIDYKVNEYILENKEDVNNESTTRGLLINFYGEYDFVILVFVIMIAGSIVSDEYNKGTIKSLLILPYKRSKILLSKLITMVIMLLFGIFAMLVIQLIVSGLFFGFSSLSVPFVTYNVATDSMVVMNVFKYFIILTVTMIPKILLLGTLAFALSTIIGSTAAAIAITFCGYIGEAIINAIAMRYDVKFLNYFVTTNWNFNELLFGGVSSFKLSLTQNIIICLLYFALMVIVSLIVFKRKDIKNI